MGIKFITLNQTFAENIKKLGYDAEIINIQDYVIHKKTYYVSPANSLCFMDGGIDRALSTIVFPNIEPNIKNIIKSLNIKNIVGKYYLPIGSSIIIDYNQHKSLIVAPTMLLPQNVSNTKNAYYATMAILFNILENKKENINNIDILFTSLCCGYGKMNEDESIKQIIQGINDYKSYSPLIVNNNIIIKEPNLQQQPKIYQNTEWFNINPSDIKNIL
uniref:Macro domain-containing protein n=1 Tax=viral metagenome TaxID=1070528 RepID=A0A6C0H7D6_9ZZZZ